MPLMSFKDAARTLDCRLEDVCDGGFDSVSIDSREAGPKSLFVALSGEQTDGHRFVSGAFERGAVCAVVQKAKIHEFKLEQSAADYRALLLPVENTLAALQKLAAAYLDGFPRLLKIGITGSSGKTTTKEIALSICGIEKKTVANKGNFNSETGLPLSVFEVRAEHEIGIFEAGMNRKGEIAELAGVLRPHIALITNTGNAHVGKIGSRREIALEKKAIFSAFTGTETAVIEADGEFADLLADGVNGRVVRYPDRPFSSGPPGLHGREVCIGNRTARFALPGEHNLRNLFAALAVARAAGISDEAAALGTALVRPLFGRGEIIEGDVTVVRDCYNANPESAAAAVELCDSAEWSGPRIYVIGSMLELGAASEEAHRELGRVLARSKAGFVFLFGAETAPAVEILAASGKSCAHTSDMNELRAMLRLRAAPGSLILLKGSRGCALERAWE